MILTVFPSPPPSSEKFRFVDHSIVYRRICRCSFQEKGCPRKKNNISPGAPSGSCLSLSPFFRFAGAKGGKGAGRGRGDPGQWMRKKKLNRYSGGSKELPMCHWSKWNHRRAFSSATTMRTPIAQKGSGRTQVTPVVVSSSCFRHRKWLTNIRGQCRLKLTAFV